jgi:hypothetical protein
MDTRRRLEAVNRVRNSHGDDGIGSFLMLPTDAVCNMGKASEERCEIDSKLRKVGRTILILFHRKENFASEARGDRSGSSDCSWTSVYMREIDRGRTPDRDSQQLAMSAKSWVFKVDRREM